MSYRKLRIAWSVGWEIAAVLLVVLWIRNYTSLTTWQILVTSRDRYFIHSVDGTLAIHKQLRIFRGREMIMHFGQSDMSWLTTNAGIRIRATQEYGFEFVSFSYWLLTIATVGTATLSWLPWRFSLRTLLLAITLLSVLLGIVAWLMN